MLDCSPLEWMAFAAADEIRDGEVVLAGTGLPMLGAMLAQRRHAPDAVLVFEAGAVDPELLDLPMSVGDSRTLAGSAQASGLFDVFTYLLQGRRVDLAFLGGAQVDQFGNVNSTAIGDYFRPRVRLPGSGGSADMAALAGRTVLLMPHEKRRLPERVDYVTSPGWLTGGDSRRRAGLGAENGPAALVTTMGVIRFRPDSREPFLCSYFPGVTPEEVQAETGFFLDLSEAAEAASPSEDDLILLRRQVDPEGIFLGRRLRGR